MIMLGRDVLFCGGSYNGTELSLCELYTPGSNTWNTFPSLLAPIRVFAMLTLGQCLDRGQPVVFGGWNGTNRVNTVYTLQDRVWRARAPMPHALTDHAAVQVDCSTAIVCGGWNSSHAVQACYLYNAKTDAWTVMPVMNTERYGHAMTVYHGLRTQCVSITH
jgi:hypothetical protein